jgi:hypothetical protein
MIENSSHLDRQLIKFAGQYSQWSDLRHLGWSWVKQALNQGWDLISVKNCSL